MKDLKNSVSPIVGLIPVAHTATKSDAPIVDLQGANSATILVNTGAIASSGDYTISLVHGDNSALSDSAAVTSADLLGSFPASLVADSALAVGYVGSKRYLRVVITKNSGTSIVAGAIVLKGHLNLSPAA